MALRTGIQPSELIAYPRILDVLVDDLRAEDEDASHAARRHRLEALTR